ncbi:MAG: hypothetical protein AAB855_03400 [Patescibacteria group bacterium]
MVHQEVPAVIEQCIEKCRRSGVDKRVSDYTGVLRLLAQELLQANVPEQEVLQSLLERQQELETRAKHCMRVRKQRHGDTPVARGEQRHVPRHYSQVDDPEPSESIDFYKDEEEDTE